MSALTDLLLHGPESAPVLRQRLSISQATFSRRVEAEPGIIKFGSARATRYALSRPVRQIREFPLWQIDDKGKAWPFGVLYPVWPQGSCLVELNNGGWQWFDGLPWYLTDLRPQGFLGRAWGRRMAQQADLQEDIRLWQEEDVLLALSMHAPENLGGWLVGEESYRRWFAAQAPLAIGEENRQAAYRALAATALAGVTVGSSAGGEQPKFTCYALTGTEAVPTIVKFTPPTQNANQRRWADLLQAESIALALLNQVAIPAARARTLVDESGQTFLEVKRFDCVGALGRRGIVSLEAVQGEFIAGPQNWPAAALRLKAQNVIDEAGLQRIQRIWAFGRLIANSDMHAGNLSFFVADFPLEVAPVYDMLPMAFAPGSSGNMREEAITPQIDPVIPQAVWAEMLLTAKTFWRQVSQHEQISENFRMLAMKMEQELSDVAACIQRLA